MSRNPIDIESILTAALDDLGMPPAESLKRRIGSMDIEIFLGKLAPQVLCRIYEAL